MSVIALIHRIVTLAFDASECGFADTPMPTFELVEPRDLYVDESYQRGLSERSYSLIRRILRAFDWRRFKPPVAGPSILEISSAGSDVGSEAGRSQSPTPTPACSPSFFRRPTP